MVMTTEAAQETANDHGVRDEGVWIPGLPMLALMLVATAALVAGAIAPSSASAGTYVVRECSTTGDGHAGVPDAVYSTNGSLAFTPASDCAGAPGVGVAIGTTGNGWAGPLTASWSFVPPPGATINSVNFQRKNTSGGTYSALVSVCQPNGTCNGLSDNTGGNFVGTQFSPGGWTSFSTILQCGATCNQGGLIYVRDLEFTMLDAGSPTITSLGGDLVAGGERRGVENLVVDAADNGSGVAEASVRVNGAEVGARPQNPGCEKIINGSYGRMRPCSNVRFEIPINTENPPWQGGANRLEVCAYDLTTSGAPNAGCTTRTVIVENSCQASGGGAGATAVDGGLQKGTGPITPQITVRSTEGATVRGQLGGPAGSTTGANVCLYETVIDGSSTKRELTQIGKTKSDGTFAIQVPAGPSRKLDLIYRFNNKVVSRPNLLLNSVVVPNLRVQPKKVSNRQRVFFRGDLPGPNNDGRRVALQAKVGKKWRTFKTVKTDGKGRFEGLYRFTQTQGRVLYVFRAQVKRQAGYPYERGVSAKRRVVVSG